MSEHRFYVYVLFRPWNGQPFYVGKGQGRRSELFAHRANPHFNNIVHKAKGAIPTVIIREGLKETEAFSLEQLFIQAIGRKPNGPLTNLTNGGEGASGSIRSTKTKRLMSKKMKGNKNALGAKRTPETIAKLRFAQNNRSEEHKAKFGVALRGKKLTLNHRKKLSEAHKGKHLSEEHRANIGAAHKGMKRPDGTGQKISQSLIGNPNLKTRLGKKWSKEVREKIRKAALEREAKKRMLKQEYPR